MAQKINPISLRLGLIQVWDSTLQNYGKLHSNYAMILHNKLQIYQFLIQFFSFNNLLLGWKQFDYFNGKVLLSISYSNLDKDVLARFSKLISGWTTSEILIRSYLKSQWFSTVNLVFDYIQYLLKQNISLNKIFLNLCYVLEIQLNSKKIIHSTYGPIKGELKGFKICLSGRFDNSRNQMSKNIKYKAGSLSLANLKSYVEFINSEVHTKLGTCGLQIWLFYKIH